MRALVGLMLAVACGAGPAAAQTVGVISPSPYGPAPWWMREPIIASLGMVHTELPANRASFSATFQAVEHSAPDATKSAAAKVKALTDVLRAFDRDKVRVATTYSTRPLYEQYRDKDGNRVDNERPDKIERYETSVDVTLDVRDIALLEKVYATVMSAGPSSAREVSFSLTPDNATNTEMSRLAVADSAARARLAADASGARLGTVKLIDPTGRACQTDVLVAGAPRSYGGGSGGGGDVSEVVVTGSRNRPPPPAPPPPGETLQVTLTPPLEDLNQTACVVYAIAG
jgi:uncharacterized protein YggE